MIDTIDLSACRVLLVDDDRSSIDVLREALQGHHPCAAGGIAPRPAGW